jgi:beta-1,4-mannosyltransferase
VHSEHSKRLVTSRLGPGGKVHVIPLGNYIGVYPPPPQPRDELRRRLGLRPAQFVYLTFGQVRRYKRLPDLLTAFRAIADDDVALIVAGEPRDDAEAARLRELAAQDGRVHLDLRRIPLSDVTAVHEVADAAVFPYRDMFSSASTLLALSCGLPVVVPANSTGTEIVSAPALEPIGPAGLTAALQAVRAGDQRDRREAALATASRYDWARVAQMTEAVYELARADRAFGPSG